MLLFLVVLLPAKPIHKIRIDLAFVAAPAESFQNVPSVQVEIKKGRVLFYAPSMHTGKRESGNCRIWERIAKKLKECSQFVCRDFSRLGYVLEELAENNTRQPFVPQLVSSPSVGQKRQERPVAARVKEMTYASAPTSQVNYFTGKSGGKKQIASLQVTGF